jgi:hypothetical protein
MKLSLFFNILRYLDDGLEQQLNNPDRESLLSVISEFCRSHSPVEILACFNQLSGEINGDFWSFFAKFRIDKKLEEGDFEKFLSNQKPNIRPILLQTTLRSKFRRSLREHFLSNVENVSFWIERNEGGHTSSPAIPIGITTEDELSLISAYIDSENPSLDYLEIFANSKEVPVRMRLAAQRRAQEVTAKIFNSTETFNFGIEIAYREQEEAVKIDVSEGITKYYYDLDWIQTNPDKPTLLNNFIHLFNYIDSQGRLTLCFQMYELGVLERTMLKQRTDWYPNSVAFAQKDHAALLQLHSYSSLIKGLDTSIEELINWFFRDYMKAEFEINNFQSDLPVGNRTFIENANFWLLKLKEY